MPPCALLQSSVCARYREYAYNKISLSNIPPLHIGLYVQKVLETNAPWLSWGCFKHKTAKLGVEDRCRICYPSDLVNTSFPALFIRTHFVSPVCTSGTPPPSARSFSSVASAARMSAWRRDSRTLRLF